MNIPDEILDNSIAIVGMACRLPGADTIDEFWDNLENGRDSFTDFSEQECIASGHAPRLVRDPAFVRRGAVLAQPDWFDARFFGYTPREADLLDPQHRVFLECCWEAVEHAGYDTNRMSKAVGVYAGCGVNNYLLKQVMSAASSVETSLDFQAIISNDKDYLASRVAYKLGLTGPAVCVQTACSTSLVAVSMACSTLLAGQCDYALAGGVSLQWPRGRGYLFKEGEIFSPDGRVRTFDRAASGTVLGEGAAVVLLKRATEAIADRDMIWALIRGSAINNDGAAKTGFTAPSVSGQAAVIRLAHALAGVDAGEIGHVEAHGTGTPLGDPIEVAGLTEAFHATSRKQGYCALGSLKTQVGHLDVAAGVAGLVKTALMLRYRKLLPVLNFREPNPDLRLSESPFYVADRVCDWESNGAVRIAGVSSFGIGGTNAHAVLQEPPPREPSNPVRAWRLLPFSARSAPALDTCLRRMSAHLAQHPEISLADVANTLQTGRREFSFRSVVAARTVAEFADNLGAHGLLHAQWAAPVEDRPVAFLLSGQGAQYGGMGAGLYRDEIVYRASIDRCLGLLKPHMSGVAHAAVREALTLDATNDLVDDTEVAQPAIFSLEYALWQLWESWGIRPSALIGHSLGELTAALLAGVFSLEDGCAIIAARGRLMQTTPEGAMTVVLADEDRVARLLDGSLEISVVNAPAVTAVSGMADEIAGFEKRAADRGIECRRLHVRRAFHSRLMDGVMAGFEEILRGISLHAPRIPFVSNVTGEWIKPSEATNPAYWRDHARKPVMFSKGLATLMHGRLCALLEIGPGNTLVTIAKQQPCAGEGVPMTSSVRHPKQHVEDAGFLLRSLGQLWCCGVSVHWNLLGAGENLCRVALPTYPFERSRHCLNPHGKVSNRSGDSASRTSEADGHRKTRYQERHILEEAIEDRLRKLWSEILGVSPIGDEDSFFDLGGHSLLAAQLFGRIKQEFGRALPLSLFLEMPTIAHLAAVFKRNPGSGESWKSLVPIRQNGNLPPVYLVHGAEGNVLLYRSLVSHLLDQPVWGLQAQGVDGALPGLTSITEMAARYVREIMHNQPAGPYYVGGYCMGGMVALEVAQQLIAAGQRVGLLLLIESYNARALGITENRHNRYKAVHSMQNLFFHGMNFIASIEQDPWRFVAQKAATVRMRASLSLRAAIRRMGDRLAREPIGLPHVALSKLNDHAYFAYTPQKYSGDLAVFRPSRQFAGYDDPAAGWKGWTTGAIDVRIIPAMPRGMLVEPFVKVLAAEMADCLLRARSAQSSRGSHIA